MHTGYVITHPKLGIFLGTLDKLAYWSNIYTAGASRAVMFSTPEIAQQNVTELELCLKENADVCEFFAVETGRWDELQAIGLDVVDMPFNDPRFACHASEVFH